LHYINEIKMAKRKLTWTGRLQLRNNALKGVKKWEHMSHRERVRARHKKNYSWGFEGRSPNTRPRKHKSKSKYKK